jgi:hypothetical protein
VAVVVSPYLYHAFHGVISPPVRPNANRHFLDLANIIFPTKTTWLRPSGSGSITSHFTSSLPEVGGYLGILLPVLLVIALVTIPPGRVRRGAWLLLIAALLADAMAAGPEVTAAGHPLAKGVWSLVVHVPALGKAMPIRLAMYAVLFIALLIALWLAQPGGAWRFYLAGLAIVLFLPNPSGAFWARHLRNPSFFTTSAYRQVIHRRDVALVLPYVDRASWSMYWQAETGFWFRMIGGHTGQALLPSECRWAGDWESLGGGEPPGGAAGFRKFLLAHHVNEVIEAPATTTWPRRLIAASLPDVQPVDVRGTKVYRLRPGLPLALPRGGPRLNATGYLNTDPGEAICGR